MKIYKVQFGYIYGEDKAALVEERIALLWPTLPDVVLDCYGSSCGDLWINPKELLALIEIKGLDMKVVDSKEVVTDSSQVFQTYAEKQFQPISIESPQYNQKVEVHIPNMALMTYNETLLLEDSCTDVLQSALDKGWRIISACPQAQRRPDYILGRYNPNRDICDHGGANRYV